MNADRILPVSSLRTWPDDWCTKIESRGRSPRKRRNAKDCYQWEKEAKLKIDEVVVALQFTVQIQHTNEKIIHALPSLYVELLNHSHSSSHLCCVLILDQSRISVGISRRNLIQSVAELECCPFDHPRIRSKSG